MKGSIQSPSGWVASFVVPISQTPRSSTATPTRSPLTSSRRFVRARVRARSLLVGSGPKSALRDDALRALIAHEHLVSEVVPDLLIDPRELRLESDLGDVPRPRQIDAIDALHGPRPRSDDDDAVDERDRLLEIVGHEDHRRARRRPELEQLVLHERARLDIKGAERLVHQEDARLVDERLGERRALAHPARELVRVVALEPGEADALDPIARALVRVATGHTAEPRTRGHVIEHALPRKDRVDLKDVSNVAPYAAHDLVSNAYLALARWLETGDERERRRFSAAGRADDRAELALLHGEVEIAQRRVRRTGRREEALRHVPKLDRGCHRREPAGGGAQRLAIRSFRSFCSFRSRCVGRHLGATCGRAATAARVPGPAPTGRGDRGDRARQCGDLIRAGEPAGHRRIREALARHRAFGRGDARRDRGVRRSNAVSRHPADRRGHPEERGSVLRRRRERRRYPLLASEPRADRPARLDRSIPGPPGSILGRYRGGHARVVGAGEGADL